jgi:hypothetical protein
VFEDAQDALTDLTDRTTADYEPARAPRQSHPKGFEPGVVRTPGKWLVTTPPMQTLGEDEASWQRAVDSLGLEVPEGWRVRLVEMRYDPAAWHRDAVGEDAVTRPVWRYRFVVEENPAVGAGNIDELVKRVEAAQVPRVPAIGGEGTFVVSWNDWQLFKNAGDGIEGTVARILESFEVVIERVTELRAMGRSYPRLLVVATGDIVEGCAIFPHQSWELQGDGRDQRNAGRRLIVMGLQRFAEHFDQIQVLAVGGNHGENRIDGKRINRHDNADCEVFEQAADVLAMNSAYDHISFSVPHDELAATIEVEGWVLCGTHGHIAGKGAGGPEAKLYGWYKGQAAGKRPPGDADILVSSHYHHARLADWGGCLWLQAPTLDGGSPQHVDLTGQDAAAGLLTFGVTRTERMRDYEVASF